MVIKKMELYFLNEDFSLIDGPIDEMTSVKWRERYFSCGSFEVRFPRSILPRLEGVSYIRSGAEHGTVKCGRIEYIETDTDGGCVAGGRLLESVLDSRVVRGRGYIEGTLSNAVTSVVAANLRDCGVEISPDSLAFAPLMSYEGVFGYGWSVLSTWVRRVLRPYGASYKIELDIQLSKPIFRLVRGAYRSTRSSNSSNLNRSADSTELAAGGRPVVFSASFENIGSVGVTRRFDCTKNVVYVEGTDGTVVTVDKSGGDPVRELHVTAEDIFRDDYDTFDLYKAALAQLGEEEMAKYPDGFFVTAQCDASALPVYGEDYFLGDICDVSDDESGISVEMRLTEVETVWECGIVSVYPKFGERSSYAKPE